MTDGQSEACQANGPQNDPAWEKYFNQAWKLADAICNNEFWDKPSAVIHIAELATLIRDAAQWRAMTLRKCSQEKPPLHQDVLLRCEGSNIWHLGWWSGSFFKKDKSRLGKVTHWMPLPQPLEEK